MSISSTSGQHLYLVRHGQTALNAEGRLRGLGNPPLDGAGGGPVVAVTHDAVIRPLIAALDPNRTNLLAPTGSWNDLVRVDGGWGVLTVDHKAGG